jgi:cytochrome c oxidase subunit 3/cytochrome o ubiquinol oxidase subunit 3
MGDRAVDGARIMTTTTVATTEHGEAPALPAGEHATSTGVSNVKLAIWMFLGSECLFFGAFISTYLLYRGRDTAGPKPKELFEIPFTSATSFILLMSSLTMVLALAAIQRGEHRRFRIWIACTALFGLTFVGGQLYEFTQFYRDGLNLHVNLFGSTFFILTGLHGAHVTVGIFWLLSLYSRSLQGKLTTDQSEAVEVAGLYWHFVDIVWIFIFTAIYLVPYH